MDTSFSVLLSFDVHIAMNSHTLALTTVSDHDPLFLLLSIFDFDFPFLSNTNQAMITVIKACLRSVNMWCLY